MARIPEAEIEQLKRGVSLAKLAEAHGVQLRRHGADLLGCCPFHADRTPSLVIAPEKNLWHCLGACQTGGSVIDWVMRVEGVSFRHAVEKLRADFPSFAAAVALVPTTSRPAPLTPIAAYEAGDEELMERVVAHYEATLESSPEAQAYLDERKIGSLEARNVFRIGFSNRTLGYRMPEGLSAKAVAMRERLQAMGIFRPSGHELLVGSVVFPLLDEAGRVVSLYGRKIGRQLRAGTANHLYLPGPRRGLWNRDALVESTEVILCEAVIDALTLWSAGHRGVTTSYGVEGFTDEHREAFRRHGTRTVRIAYDGDEAGDRAAVRLSKELLAMGISSLRVRFPEGMDANAYARAVHPGERDLTWAIERAEWLEKLHEMTVVPEAIAAPVPRSAEGDSSFAAASVAAAPPAPSSSPVSALPPAPSSPPVAAPAPAPEPPAPVSLAPPPTQALVRGEDDDWTTRRDDRLWRIRGLAKNTSAETLRVQLRVTRAERTFVDTLELYSAKARQPFVKQASEELGAPEALVKRDVMEIVQLLEHEQTTRLRALVAPAVVVPVMSASERDEALLLLRDPRLLERIGDDFARAGIVGERENLLVAYVAATSRKLERPLAIVIQSSSSAGKTSLMEAVLGLMPDEERVSYAAMTGQSLYYMAEGALRHKVLSVAEGEGAERASYALKLLQSEGSLTIASPGKDPVSGKIVTHDYRVEGPVMLFLTTTAVTMDEELLNRCLVLTVDEGREQTRAIHDRQRSSQTLEGLLARTEREHVVRLHHRAQRLLRPLAVVNPFAETLLYGDERTRSRRDHAKYLSLIQAVTLLYQHQREEKTAVTRDGEVVTYIETTRGDIEAATRLFEAVVRPENAELSPQTGRLHELVLDLVRGKAARTGVAEGEVTFTRRELREVTGLGDTQVKVHLGRLVEAELLGVTRTRGGQHVYTLQAEDEAGVCTRPRARQKEDDFPLSLLLSGAGRIAVGAAE